MADSDWVKYRQIRGKALPDAASLLGAPYRLVVHLKRDFYAATALYERDGGPGDAGPPGRVLVKVYHTDPFFGVPLGFLGRALCRRESDFLRRLDGVPGVPRLLDLYGGSGFVREFIPGWNLREYSRTRQVDGAFFPKLRAILQAVHDRGVSHNDLSKPENILVTPDGDPVLIDFQIATRVSRGWNPVLRAVSRAWVSYMQRVDHYHLDKQNSRRRPTDFTPEQRAAMERKGWIITAHGWVRRPYRAVRRVLMRNLLTDPAAPAASPPGVPAPHIRARAGTPADGVGVAEDRPTG